MELAMKVEMREWEMGHKVSPIGNIGKYG